MKGGTDGNERTFRAASYARLSREDGDKVESDSILNQQHIIEDYCARSPGLAIAAEYVDDGCTGTNFDRAGFQHMLADIEAGDIDCVIVKDLSRFGRDYIDMGYYLERYFPAHGVRFIAVNDGVDSRDGPYDMLLPLKNVFNAQYAKDISGKVRSAFRAKQRRGDFVGAFAAYGYLKDPEDRSHLVVDPAAAETVLRIFRMAAGGMGQVRIAKTLNAELVPCPSEYKRLMGEKYTNSRRLESTRYWTYATIHRMLQNELYLGNMVAARAVRPTMHGKAKAADRSDWIVVEGTHEAIVPRALWDAVRAQAAEHTRAVDFDGHVGLFAGFVKCGDCGRSLCKKVRNGRVTYACGSYERYGPTACTRHAIRETELAEIVLADLNRAIAAVADLALLAARVQAPPPGAARREGEARRLERALERVRRLKQGAYEDYRDRLLCREDFLRYRADYDAQEEALSRQLERAVAREEADAPRRLWAEELARRGALRQLDRATLAQAVGQIRVFEDRRIEVTYLFSGELRPLLEAEAT